MVLLQAGFAEIDITPPLGTLKIGWLKRIVSEQILAPLFARIVIFQPGNSQAAFVQLDTLFIAWSEVLAIRQGVEQAYGFPGANVMVAATHNHAGPAVIHAGDVPKDAAYAAGLVTKVITAFGTALERLQDVEIGFDHAYEWNVAFNRRVVMRNGTVQTHGTFDNPDSLFIEGPIDPEVAVIAVRDLNHNLMGVIVNFACHPTHFGGDGAIHPGYPGVMAEKLRANGCPYTLFFNGASGNLHTSNPMAGGQGKTAEETGTLLASDVQRVLDKMVYQSVPICLAVGSSVVDLPYRQVTEQEIQGVVRGAQRFIDSEIYDRNIPRIVDQITDQVVHPAEIQVIRLGNVFFIGVPGEYFVEYGLHLKEAAAPKHALVVSCCNGRVGYIPTIQAFKRGGYETTFGPSSMLAPEAGQNIAENAICIIKELRSL